MWPSSNLSELCDVLDRRRKPITKKDRSPGIYPYYGATGILDYVEGFLFDEQLVLIGEDGAKWGAGDNSAFKIQGKTWVNNHAHVIRPKREMVLDEWLIYYLNAEDLSKFITGMTVPKLNQGKLKEIPIPLPPIPEQQRIVAILDQAFADIEKARANAEQNLKNARELFDSYLNQVFNQRGEGWVDTLLGDVCGFKHGFAFKSEYFTQESNLVLLTPGNFFEEGGYRDRGSKQKYYSGPFPREFLLPKGCLLVAMTEQAAGLLGSSIIVPEENTFLHNQRLGLVELTTAWQESVSLEFLSQLFNAQYFRAKVQETGSGLKVRHTSPKKLQAITVWIPKDKDEQGKIVNDIARLKKETIRLEVVYKNKLKSLDELKKSLLQKAFTGELTKSKGMAA